MHTTNRRPNFDCYVHVSEGGLSSSPSSGLGIILGEGMSLESCMIYLLDVNPAAVLSLLDFHALFTRRHFWHSLVVDDTDMHRVHSNVSIDGLAEAFQEDEGMFKMD
eukprot:TRINITY_DN9958_c0_g1_i1.p2 TRINITY_DN9958_c0_g1~~TRINITY_DN9958_c0_g1_i1.p2  ORF type:complete len:107 (+),score=8.30 TRINITY_DN9958_c0_g1_i1:3168-3488(+)